MREDGRTLPGGKSLSRKTLTKGENTYQGERHLLSGDGISKGERANFVKSDLLREKNFQKHIDQRSEAPPIRRRIAS